MKFDIYRLYFKSPVHISSAKDDLASSRRMMHSDTLYAAITDTWYLLYPDVPAPEDYTVSSLFPFYEYEKRKFEYFFPKPKISYEVDPKEVEIKAVKKIRWLAKEFFEKWISGRNIFDEMEKEDLTELLSRVKKNGGYLSYHMDHSPLVSSLTPRVAVPRAQGEDSRPFEFEKLFFRPSAGWYFLADFEDEDTRKRVEKVLTFLQEEGMATDKFLGMGRFELERDTLTLDVPENGEKVINLSLFIPEDDFDFKKVENFALLRRGGYITTHPWRTLRKKSVYAFEEGSVFQGMQGNRSGKTVDLKPDGFDNTGLHPVYRNGKSIFIPVHTP